MRTLVYIGANHGHSLVRMLHAERFDRVFVFEPVPQLAANLRQVFAACPEVEVVEAACAEVWGTATLHLSDNSNQSASLGTLKPEAVAGRVQHTGAVQVRTVHLGEFLAAQGVERIDSYVSDAQGMDLAILKTMGAYLAGKRIGTIQAETAKDERLNLYEGLPPNNLSAFRALLEPHGYRMVGCGWEAVQAGTFEVVPADWWEFDTVWA